MVIVGAGRADQQVEFTPFELLFDGKKMLASLYGSADVRRDYARMLSLWRAGRLDLEGMITQRLKLDDIDQPWPHSATAMSSGRSSSTADQWRPARPGRAARAAGGRRWACSAGVAVCGCWPFRPWP